MNTALNTLVLGSGAREHALADSLGKSPLVQQVWVAPGNAGIRKEWPGFEFGSFGELVQKIREHRIGLVVIGPETYLVEGLVDFLQNHPDTATLHIIGPDRACAALEGSKDFAKTLMREAGIPTAEARTFFPGQMADMEAYIRAHALPVVVKADGLAAGKGVAVCLETEEALAFARSVLEDGVFGDQNRSVLVESFLDGIEVSLFALCDGKHYQLLPEAKDYKRIGEGDTGPNTGGMGSVSPVPFVDAAFTQKVCTRILDPLFAALQKRGLAYRGFLFVGLMNVQGEPFVVEFNARLGDPETQSILQRLEGDWVPALLAVRDQQLHQHPIAIRKEAAATVVVCAEGYPGPARTGDILHLEKPEPGTRLYFAGVGGSPEQLETKGGRVLSCTATGHTLSEALEKAYRLREGVRFAGAYSRGDIGRDLGKV